MSKSFPVSGLKELDTYLAALPKNLQKAAYRSALTAAGAVIRDEAKIRAKGRIPSAIKTGSPRQNQDGTFSVRVYVDERKYYDAYTAFFQEFGVKPHFISAGDSDLKPKMLTKKARNGGVVGDVETKALKIGDNFITGAVFHPGHAASPFMRPALDTKADEAVKAFGGRIRAFLEKKTGFVAPIDEAA